MASPFSWPVLVPYALRAPAPVNLGVSPAENPLYAGHYLFQGFAFLKGFSFGV